MKTQYQKSRILTLVIVSLFLSTCRKDISVPNPELEELFGTWDWIQTTCGWSGSQSPSTIGHSQTAEFDKNGIYKLFQDGKQIDKRKFTLTQGTSIHSTGTAYLIKYKDAGLLHKKKYYTEESVTFHGQDTLFLDEEAYDGCGHIFVKQK